MKIHLVTPKNPPSFWTYDAILDTLGKGCIFPNLSMPTIAGLTPPGHELSLCDENVSEIDFDVDADIVGITGYIIHRDRIIEIAQEFRRRGRRVVIGGPFATLCPEEVRPYCDFLFCGEAEETWPRFIADLEAGVAAEIYEPDEKPDLSEGPMPRFDLLEVDRYHALTIQFARGCPFNCEFCDIIVMYGRRPRAKSTARLMAEIEEVHRLGAKQVFIVDDNFIGNKKLAKELLHAMASWGAERGYPLDFNTEVSLDVAQDEELLSLMRAANFTTVFIGIETPRVESLLETRKTQNTRGDLLSSVHKVHEYGIQVQGGMIVGFDNDDISIFEEQLRFNQEARIPVSMTGMLQALPETPLHARVKKEGRLLAESQGDQFALSNIVPAGMSRLELYRGYRSLIIDLYSFRRYRERAMGFLLHRGDQIHGGRNMRAGDAALGRRIFKEILFSNGIPRALFSLRFLAEVMVRRSSRIKEAVSFAITHKAMSDYVDELTVHLDAAIAEIEREARA